MSLIEWLEAGMLISFSFGWYWSVMSMLRTKIPQGKSAPFVAFTILGYALGLAAKLLVWQQGGSLSHVALIYSWNLAVTMLDLVLVFHFSRESAYKALQANR